MTRDKGIGLGCIFSLAILLHSCSSSNELGRSEPLAGYGSAKLDVGTEIKVFHHSADSSTVFVKFNTENLLYSKGEEGFEASVTVELEPALAEEGEVPAGLQKKTVAVPPIAKSKTSRSVLAKTDLYLPQGKNYNLAITIRDATNGKSALERLNVDKTTPNDRENFLAFEGDGPIPVFGDRIKPNTQYCLDLGKGGSETIDVNYYNRSFPLPPPPFTFYEPKRFDYVPDDSFDLTSISEGYCFTSKMEGFYHFRSDNNAQEGFTLFISSDEFPKVEKVQNMIDPFRYLVSGKEYKKLLEAPVLKAEIEKYWVEWAGDRSRAKNSIEAYYERVELANRFFSSHLEGWKSDRGLVYIIYGEPDKIYRTDQLETWVYGEERNPLSITFRFLKVINPFTENDFRLNREDYYKPSWYRSIEAWRNGRVY